MVSRLGTAQPITTILQINLLINDFNEFLASNVITNYKEAIYLGKLVDND